MLVLVSRFLHAKDNAPKPIEIDWEDFVSHLSTHKIMPGDKDRVPAICPAEWPEGETRSKRGALRAWFGALDFDKLTAAEMQDTLERASGLDCLLYTTWSHPERLEKRGTWSFRLVFPFTRPVEADEWGAFWPRLDAHLGSRSDLKCRHISAIYFVPSAGAPSPHHRVERQPGAPLDVDAVLTAPEPPKRLEVRIVGPADLEELASRLVRHPSPALKAVAAAIRLALQGQPFAPNGDRDAAMYRIAGELTKEWPDADPDRLAGCFGTAIDAMVAADPSGDCPTKEDFLKKLVLRQQQAQDDRAAKEEARRNALAMRIREAFSGARDEPYTEEELDSYAAQANIDRDGFRRRWVVQIGRNYYLFKAGSYGHPLMGEELVLAAERDLSPAEPAGVEIWKVNESGDLRPKTSQELTLQYGVSATSAVVDMCAQRSYYDAKACTLVEAPCPRRPLEPEFSRPVEEWLVALGGPEAGRLFDWVAVVTALEEPCAALYLDGEPGSGKTLFADALSRIWTTGGPTPLSEVVGAFNDCLLRCPLVLADEVLPEVLKKSEGTGSLRQLVQARQFVLSRKHKPTAPLKGSLRIVLTANNRHMLETREQLTPADVDAIAERILYIRATREARRVLDGLGHEAVRKFVVDDVVARHALWLRDQRQVKRTGRFLVTGIDSALHRALTTSRGFPSAVCNWCVSYLLEPGRMDTTGKLLVRIRQRELYVTAKALSDHWDMYPTNMKAPMVNQAGRALSGLCYPGKTQMKDGSGNPMNYWHMKTDSLLTWADEMKYVPAETILEALKSNAEV